MSAACGGSNGGGDGIDAVLADPAAHEGEAVDVRAAVSKPIDHRVWEMADGKLFVIYDPGVQQRLVKGEELHVVGTVRRFDKQVIERDAGVDIEDHFFTDDFLADDAVVVASLVERLAG